VEVICKVSRGACCPRSSTNRRRGSREGSDLTTCRPLRPTSTMRQYRLGPDRSSSGRTARRSGGCIQAKDEGLPRRCAMFIRWAQVSMTCREGTTGRLVSAGRRSGISAAAKDTSGTQTISSLGSPGPAEVSSSERFGTIKRSWLSNEAGTRLSYTLPGRGGQNRRSGVPRLVEALAHVVPSGMAGVRPGSSLPSARRASNTLPTSTPPGSIHQCGLSLLGEVWRAVTTCWRRIRGTGCCRLVLATTPFSLCTIDR
jgi:hypothetical protein